jgi:hypothetical protein
VPNRLHEFSIPMCGGGDGGSQCGAAGRTDVAQVCTAYSAASGVRRPAAQGHHRAAQPHLHRRTQSSVRSESIAAPGLGAGNTRSQRFEHTACTSSAVCPCEPSALSQRPSTCLFSSPFKRRLLA